MDWAGFWCCEDQCSVVVLGRIRLKMPGLSVHCRVVDGVTEPGCTYMLVVQVVSK